MSLIIGIAISVGFILFAVILDGDSPVELIGVSAAMIVLGGTTGAVITQFGLGRIGIALKAVKTLLKPPKADIPAFITNIGDWSNLARAQGSLALETVLETTKDPLQKKGLQMIIDNTSQEDLQTVDFRRDLTRAFHRELTRVIYVFSVKAPSRERSFPFAFGFSGRSCS